MNTDDLYLDLGTDEVSRLALLADKALTVDEFAAKYAPLIRAHEAADDAITPETAYQEAVDLWGYLRGKPAKDPGEPTV